MPVASLSALVIGSRQLHLAYHFVHERSPMSAAAALFEYVVVTCD